MVVGCSVVDTSVTVVGAVVVVGTEVVVAVVVAVGEEIQVVLKINLKKKTLSNKPFKCEWLSVGSIVQYLFGHM